MKILVLAGTSEAREICAGLSAQGHDVTASLAGATRAPAPLGCAMRVGGFGGAAHFATFLRANGIEAIIDATHPFAHRMSHRSAQVARDMRLRYLQVLRDPWQARARDSWTYVSRPEATARYIEPGERVFLATGRQTLEQFMGIDAYFICRQIDPPEGPFPLPKGEFLVGRPPFSVEDEQKLFDGLNLDWLVVKDAGGDASRSKLDAAANLRLPVLMIERPEQPDCLRVTSVNAALKWIEHHAHH